LGEDAVKANLNNGDAQLQKPVLLYLTDLDSKKAKKLKAWEESRLVDDKLIVAVRLFQCYTVDVRSLPKDHELTAVVKKNKTPSFIVINKGEVFTASGKEPSSSKILSTLKKSISKLCGASMDKIVKKGVDLKKEREKLDNAIKEVDKKMRRLKKDDRRRTKYQKEKTALKDQDSELIKKENELYDIKLKS